MDEFAAAQPRLFAAHGVEAESHFVDAPSIKGRAHVVTAGGGPPVMMIIGGGVPAAMWTPLMAEMQDRFTLHAVDLPSHGLTSPTRYARVTVRSLAVGFLGDVLDGLGLGRAPFVAQSIGGLWSIWLALDEPSRVQSLSCIGCPAALLGTSAPMPFRIMSVRPIGKLLMRLQKPSRRQVDKLGRMAGEDFDQHPELRDLMVALERIPHYGSDFVDLVHTVVRPRGAQPDVMLTAQQLAGVSTPTQIIWGTDDTFGPPSAGRRAARIIPNAEFHEVNGGHAPWLDSTAEIAELVRDFLGRHTTPSHDSARDAVHESP